jgi:hypothetical protein
MDERFQIIDAFVDGERVDTAALKLALADSDGRDYLVDAWLIRETVQEEIAADAAAPVPPAVAPPARRVPWLIAVAAAVVCLIGGYLLGARLPRGAAPSDVTAAVTPTAPAGVPGAVVVTPRPEVVTSFPVPQPTRVIRLELGADWKESSGGG